MGCLLMWDRCSALHGAEEHGHWTSSIFLLRVMEYRLINEGRVSKHETMKLFKSSTPNPTLCFIERRTSVPVTSQPVVSCATHHFLIAKQVRLQSSFFEVLMHTVAVSR